MTSQSLIDPNDTWTKIIRPKRGLFDLRLRELWRARELIMLFVWRDFVSIYKQTILGPLWYVIQPVLTTVVFTVIFGNIAKLSTDGLPPFSILYGREHRLELFQRLHYEHLQHIHGECGDFWQGVFSTPEYPDFGGHLQFDFVCDPFGDISALLGVFHGFRLRNSPQLVDIKPAAAGAHHGFAWGWALASSFPR